MTYGHEIGIDLKDTGKNLIIELALQGLCLGVGLKDVLLILHQLIGGKTLTVDQSLLAVEIVRDSGSLSLGDFEVVAEYAVVSELEDRDSALGFDLIQITLEYDVTVVPQSPSLIQEFIVSVEDDLTFLELSQTLFVDCLVYALHQFRTGCQGILIKGLFQ